MQVKKTRIENIRGNLITIQAIGPAMGELAEVVRRDTTRSLASVIRIDSDKVTLQVFDSTRGISVNDEVVFLRDFFRLGISEDCLGSVFSGSGKLKMGVDAGRDRIEIGRPSFNPMKRRMPSMMIRTNLPMIDMFNTFVRGQKIPLFCSPGSKPVEVLCRIANQTDADVVIIGGMGLTQTQYAKFIHNARTHGSLNRTIFYAHLATDPVNEAVMVPDLALAAAEYFALKGKNVLVLLTDMVAFADALKEIAISLDFVPANRGYSSDLYTQLAMRYEKAVEIEGNGAVTILASTTLPANDVTHPIPDLTGYITEGQFYLNIDCIEPFGSLSRLKQLVIGKTTRPDHGHLANAMIRLYADALKAKERDRMGFKLSGWDNKLLRYQQQFRTKFMSLDVNIPLEEALDLGWKVLSDCFEREEVGIKKEVVDIHWI